VRFGIAYDGASESGVDISSWTACNAALEFPYGGWPAAGSGNTVIWESADCTPVLAGQYYMFVAGYFQLTAHTPDELSLRPHPLSNLFVVDCGGNEDALTSIVDQLGWAVFSAAGTAHGSSPCGFFLGSCHISGPDSIGTGELIQYFMRPEEVSTNGFWTVAGDVAEITSSNNASATVHALAPGPFSIVYQREFGCVEGCGCSQRIQVLGTTPVRPATWGRIKARFASH
jgi:hypothetical protein